MMSYIHDKMKQKAMKLHFIFCKKSFKVNNILESVMFKKKKFQLQQSANLRFGKLLWKDL